MAINVCDGDQQYNVPFDLFHDRTLGSVSLYDMASTDRPMTLYDSVSPRNLALVSETDMGGDLARRHTARLPGTSGRRFIQNQTSFRDGDQIDCNQAASATIMRPAPTSYDVPQDRMGGGSVLGTGSVLLYDTTSASLCSETDMDGDLARRHPVRLPGNTSMRRGDDEGDGGSVDGSSSKTPAWDPTFYLASNNGDCDQSLVTYNRLTNAPGQMPVTWLADKSQTWVAAAGGGGGGAVAAAAATSTRARQHSSRCSLLIVAALILACGAMAVAIFSSTRESSSVSAASVQAAVSTAADSSGALIAAMNATLNSVLAQQRLLLDVVQSLNISIENLTEVAAASRAAPPLSTFQSGMVVAWHGSATNIPQGFAICDGSSGTPDLRGKFILGVATSGDVGTVGGSSTVTLSTGNLPSHSHSASSTFNGNALPGHNHAVNDGGHRHSLGSLGIHGYVSQGTYSCTGGLWGTSYDNVRCYSMGPTDSSSSSISLSGSSAGTPTGSVSTSVSATGSGTPFSNMPPYHGLIYIMKL